MILTFSRSYGAIYIGTCSNANEIMYSENKINSQNYSNKIKEQPTVSDRGLARNPKFPFSPSPCLLSELFTDVGSEIGELRSEVPDILDKVPAPTGVEPTNKCTKFKRNGFVATVFSSQFALLILSINSKKIRN